MAQILLIESDKQFSALLRPRLESKIERDVIIKASADEAISLLQILPEVDLIIARVQISKDQTFQKLSKFFNENNDNCEKPIPLLILGAVKTELSNVKMLPTGSSPDEIVHMAQAMLGLLPVQDLQTVKNALPEKAPLPNQPVGLVQEKTRPKIELPKTPEQKMEYVELNTKFLLNLNNLEIPFDSYTRTKTKDKSFDYTLKIPAKSIIERSGIERLLTRGITELYVKKEQYESARKFAEENLIFKIFDQSITGLDRVQLCSDAFDITLDLISQQCFDELTFQLVEYNVASLKKIVQMDNVFILFENSRKIKNLSYGFAHCFLTSVLLHKILKADWVTTEIKDKLFYITYLHDMGLAEDKLIYHHHHVFRDRKTMTEEEYQIVNHHSLMASIAADKLYPTLGIASFIKEHHGIKSGKGFSESLSIIASPFIMYFITVEDFVTRYLEIKAEVTPDALSEIFSAMEKKFNKLAYDSALKALLLIYR